LGSCSERRAKAAAGVHVDPALCTTSRMTSVAIRLGAAGAAAVSGDVTVIVYSFCAGSRQNAAPTRASAAEARRRQQIRLTIRSPRARSAHFRVRRYRSCRSSSVRSLLLHIVVAPEVASWLPRRRSCPHFGLLVATVGGSPTLAAPCQRPSTSTTHVPVPSGGTPPQTARGRCENHRLTRHALRFQLSYVSNTLRTVRSIESTSTRRRSHEFVCSALRSLVTSDERKEQRCANMM
jgi:hypothetical protein